MAEDECCADSWGAGGSARVKSAQSKGCLVTRGREDAAGRWNIGAS